MDNSFFIGNRQELYEKIEAGSLAVVFSGSAPRKTNDEYYPFFANRNFMYLTGVDQSEAILLCLKDESPEEMLYIPPPDVMIERWQGRRVKDTEASDISGIEKIQYINEFEAVIDRALLSGDYGTIYIPLFKKTSDEPDGPEYRLVRYIKKRFPHIAVKDLMPQLKAVRFIKKPCEIAAMKEAQIITREAILAMMKASKPSMMEYEYRAEFDYVLMKHGIAAPAFPPIISAGKNNFSIHYHGCGGVANDGDMILNDVGAWRDNVMNDVSRAWPCNGRFNERQRLLYQCAYETSNYMFGKIKPGMPMGDVDAEIKRYNFERLKEIGVCKSFDKIGTYMWHGGAHHVGWDVHDVVAVTPATPIASDMVFCVDIGIYHEEWGIGFRLEDNCLVTENGCENLSKEIPRSIEEIESFMKK